MLNLVKVKGETLQGLYKKLKQLRLKNRLYSDKNQNYASLIYSLQLKTHYSIVILVKTQAICQEASQQIID